MELLTDQVFVLHVKKGYEDRAKHIETMMSQKNIPFEYILDGDMEDLNDTLLKTYFLGDIQSQNPVASCACKHFFAYEKIIERNLNGALILEDDIFLTDHFIEIFNQCIYELNHREDLDAKHIFISFENTRMRFVPKSRLKKNQHLYKGNKDRMAGAYYLTHDTAKQILSYVYKNKTDLPIDALHGILLAEENLPYYWCEPAVAEQGSHSGVFKSGINKNPHYFFFKKWKWRFKKCYKKTLYFFR